MLLAKTARSKGLRPLASERRVPLQSKPPTGDGSDANKEMFAMADDRDLDREASEKMHGRRERIFDHIADLAIIGIYLFFVIVVVSGVVWAYHVIMPADWHSLTPSEVQGIQDKIFHVAVGFVLGFLIQNKFLSK